MTPMSINNLWFYSIFLINIRLPSETTDISSTALLILNSDSFQLIFPKKQKKQTQNNMKFE